jgi:2-hydroxychromene-2-carboxylate isomerase
VSDFANPAKLYFFFDYISHNAYLAWHKAPALASACGLSLEPVPVLFAGLLKAYGQVGPAEVPPKARWMIRNVLRKARYHGIPLAPPHSHPFNPLLPLRLSCIDMPREQQLDLITRLFRATWAESRAVHTPEAMREVLGEAGLDAEALLGQADSEPVKRQLRDNTDAALRAGVFGVPTFIARGELFWGFDDLPQLEHFLRGADTLGSDRSVHAWNDIRPTAERKR